jgi:hypothetical protein
MNEHRSKPSHMLACVHGSAHKINAIMSHSSPAVEYTVHTGLQDAACEPSSLFHGNSNAFESSPQIASNDPDSPSAGPTGPVQNPTQGVHGPIKSLQSQYRTYRPNTGPTYSPNTGRNRTNTGPTGTGLLLMVGLDQLPQNLHCNLVHS